MHSWFMERAEEGQTNHEVTMSESESMFIPLGIALLTVSDSRSQEDDRSGQLLAERIQQAGHLLRGRKLVPDDNLAIVSQLRAWIAQPDIEVIIATGGTGVTGRDVTPEAFHSVYEKEIPGFGELFRMISYSSIGASTIQSRATAGIASGTFLFALPGSPGACQDGWDKIINSQLDSRHQPCNLARLLPRLTER